MPDRSARTDHPIHALLKARWSPYGFRNQPLSPSDIQALFEAARWSASSYNEQPWRFLAAERSDTEQFAKLLSCLVDGNRKWAGEAPLLVLGAVTRTFADNGNENTAALHDLGLATQNLTVEATHRGISVHPMIGILPDRARELFHIPVDCVACTALAIGYAEDPENLTDKWRERDQAPRHRKPLKEFVFSGTWGEASPLIKAK